MGLLDRLFGLQRPPPKIVRDRSDPVVTQTTAPSPHREPQPLGPDPHSGFDGAPPAGGPTVAIGGVSVGCTADTPAQLAAIAAQPTVGVRDLGAAAFAIEAAFPGVTRDLPHPGIQVPAPWNFAALLRTAPADAAVVRAALAQYLDADFIRRPAQEKRAVLDTLAPLLNDFARVRLERWHLPRLAATSTKQPVTIALESETHHLGRIYRYYAPDPSGKLVLAAMNDPLKQKLLEPGSQWALRARSPVESRMSDDVWLASLRWKDLSPSAQHEYLKGVQQTIDPHVKLHRITDPKHAPTGEIAPASLQDTLKWERELKLTIAELITKGSYDSLDVSRADREWIGARFDGGFHLHAVTELSSAEDKKRLGPKIAALAALHDLALFSSAAASHASNYTHVFLEPWTAGFAGEIAASFDKGAIDADAIMPHKFHFVGMRTGIYGQEDRLGIEIRGVQPNLRDKFDHATERVVELLSGGGLERLPSPPWPGWDAGEKNVGQAFEDQARADMRAMGPRGAELVDNAKLSFMDVMEMVVTGSGKKNGFAFAAPLWNFEAIPGLTDDDKARIGAARRGFTDALLVMSELLSKQIDLGRDLDALAPQVYEHVITAAMAFFQTAGIDTAVERVLDQASMPPRSS